MHLDPTPPGWRSRRDPPGLLLHTDSSSLPVLRAWPTGVAVSPCTLERDRRMRVQLQGAGQPLRGLDGRVDRRLDGEVEIRFHGLDERRRDAVMHFLKVQLASGLLHAPLPAPPLDERTEDPAEIRVKLLALRRHALPLSVRSEAFTGGARVLAVGEGHFHLDLPALPPGTRLRLQSASRYFVHHFEAEVLEHGAQGLRLRAPASWTQARARAERRVLAPEGAVARFAHPDIPGHVVEAAVQDLSHTGLALLVDPLAHYLYPGMVVPRVEVSGVARETVELAGSLRLGDARPGIVGVHLDAPAPRRWHAAVGDLASPGTRLGATWSEMSWDLFRRARYFEISGRSEAHFAPLKRPFAEVYRRLDSHPEVGCQVVHTSARGLEGTISLLRLYTASIFGFQIARRQDDAPGFPDKYRVLREMTLRAYEQTRVFAGVRWQIGYVPAEASWSRFVHCDHPKRYEALGLACVLPFRAYEVDCTQAVLGRSTGLRIGEATPGELALLLAQLAQSRPAAYVDSLDLVPERFALGDLLPAWRRAGLERSRTCLVARRGERPVAFAVVETAQPGLQLFGLLDSVRLYDVTPDGAAAFGALTDAARAWSLGTGRRRVSLLHEGPPFPETRQFVDLGPAELSIVSVEVLPNILEFVWETMADRKSVV